MEELKKITYLSKLDNSMQPALFLPAEGNEPRPLAVCLHTWSYGIDKAYDHFLERCKERNWHFIFPYFRGPNKTPQACGSDLVVSDLECAIDFVRENYLLDESKIYLVGGSGGGHAALLMAGRRPELWTAVSAWCPITDVAKWCAEISVMKPNPEDRSYDYDIMDACGGDPVKDEKAAKEAAHRSPLTHLPGAKGKVTVEIGTGIHDGHPGVPVSHAVRAFNALASEEDRVSEEDMEYMDKMEAIPEHLKFRDADDPAFGPCKVLFRRISGRVRITLFEGGHDLLPGPAFGWLERQTRNAEPVWKSGEFYDIKPTELTK
ncbi:MAG: prolyl oligopeptidase family serine peptidase [Lentisphaeria bacterium]|nr:prolyl oligopeptidase family serine peptidase [Lentisphaeria bacterium]